jgi:hypothetical protein
MRLDIWHTFWKNDGSYSVYVRYAPMYASNRILKVR